MINDKVREILNEQINKELGSAYIYLAMSAYLADIGLYGFAHWTEVQSREEIDHAMILYKYILDRKAKVVLKPIQIDNEEYSGPVEVCEKIYEHERMITSSIDCVAYLTEDECDLATRNFIDWYLNEQIEEESSVLKVLSKFKAFGSEKASLYLLDKELGEREYSHQTYES
ncbi:ferritin [bacterium]|nr:ferritin [bacterium]